MFDSSWTIQETEGRVEANELARRALSGCAESIAELTQRFRPRLYQLLVRRFDGRCDDAEDVCQEALLRAFHHLDRFDPKYQFTTWLYTIALRIAIDYQRRQRRERKNHCEFSEQTTVDFEPKTTSVDDQEEAENVWTLAKEVLGSEQYTAMWLRYGEDLTVAEVARAMRRTQVSIRVLLHRSRSILVKTLSDRTKRIAPSKGPGA